MSLRVRLRVDGSSILGTRMYDADTGKELDLRRVAAVRFEHRFGSLPRLAVEFMGADAEVEATLETGDQELARRYLAQLGKADHPCAARDPVGALGQVAVDLAQAAMRPKRAASAAPITDHLPDGWGA